MTTHTNPRRRRAELALERDDLWTTLAALTRAQPADYDARRAVLNARLTTVSQAIAQLDEIPTSTRRLTLTAAA
jgi:hypothetical protein